MESRCGSHYARPDAFQLTVRTTADPIIRVEEAASISKSMGTKEEAPTNMEMMGQELSKFEGG